MRIAYLIAWRGGLRTGPFKKMAAQADAWIEAGHEVRMFVTTSPEAYDDWLNLGDHVAAEVAGRSARARGVARRRSYRALRSWAPHVIYLRHGVFAPGIAKLARAVPTVIEVNGDELTMARKQSLAKGIWTGATRGLLLRHVCGAVFMTGELARSPRFRGYQFARLILGNGISLAAVPELPPNDLPTLGLAMLGHPDSPWHGADKLAAVAARHPDWRIDIIGIRRKELPAVLPANVSVHPEMATVEYLPILQRSDVGVGTLALHRLGVDEATPLKVREYLALGMPVIIGYTEPDIPADAPYQLRLPNVEASVEANDEQIAAFVERWHGRRLQRSAVAHLDSTIKEAIRLAFFDRCIAGGRGAAA